MQILELNIGNFRSLHNQKFKFDQSNVNIIVGENNTGKTSILKALEYLFSPAKKTALKDKNVKYSDIIKISIKFTPNSRERNKFSEHIGKEISTKTIIIERKHKYDSNAKYYINHEEVRGFEFGAFAQFLSSKFLLINPLRDIELEDIEKEWDRKLSYRQLTRYMRERVIIESQKSFKRLNNYLKPKLIGITDSLKEALRLPEGTVTFSFAPDIEEVLDNIKFFVDQNDGLADLRAKGQGIRSQAAMIFRGAFSSTDNPQIIAIEEPELHLHPSMVRILIRNINKNAQTGKQFILTSHSQNAIDSLSPGQIRRVCMDDAETIIIQPNLNKNVIQKFYRYVLCGHSGVFYSKRCVIVEGESDRNFLRLISDRVVLKMGRRKITGSLDEQNISLISVDGQEFDKPIPFLKSYKIDWLILGDCDKWASGFYIKCIESIGLNNVHKKAYKELKTAYDNKKPLDKSIRMKLYKYFNIISFPEELEEAILMPSNLSIIKKIFRSELNDRYLNAMRNSSGLNNYEICKKLLRGTKSEWSIALGKKLKEDEISPILKNLIKLLVLHPKTGSL